MTAGDLGIAEVAEVLEVVLEDNDRKQSLVGIQ